MKTLAEKMLFSTLLTTSLLLSGCSSYDPVPVSKCSKVVSHAKKTLGKLAPKYSEMMASCKKASDQERGCIMAATKAGQVAQCM